MGCSECKKKKPVKRLPTKTIKETQKEIDRVNKIVAAKKEELRGDLTPEDYDILREGRKLATDEKNTTDKQIFNPDPEAMAGISENGHDVIHLNTIKPYPSVDEIRLVDDYFNSRYKLNHAEANRIFQMIFNEDINPAGCRGCGGRSHRKWIAWIGDMLTPDPIEDLG